MQLAWVGLWNSNWTIVQLRCGCARQNDVNRSSDFLPWIIWGLCSTCAVRVFHVAPRTHQWLSQWAVCVCVCRQVLLFLLVCCPAFLWASALHIKWPCSTDAHICVHLWCKGEPDSSYVQHSVLLLMIHIIYNKSSVWWWHWVISKCIFWLNAKLLWS